MTTLLNIRFIQLKRNLDEAGPSILVVGGILCFLVFASYQTFMKTPDAYYLTGFMILACFAIQSYRKDKEFVYTHIAKPHWEIFSEYFVLTFPFSVCSLFTINWICFPLLLAGLLIVPLFRYTFALKTYFKNVSSIIPAEDFELISGFRKSFVYLIPLYILALGFCWFKIFPLLMLWFISVSVASFYGECEPLLILQEPGLPPREFMRQKLIRHCKYLVLLYLPIVVINTIFNMDYWFLNLLFILVQISLLCFAICLKYSGYQPAKNQVANNTILSIGVIGSIIPYYLPILLFMAVEFYYKAKNNLSNYLV